MNVDQVNYKIIYLKKDVKHVMEMDACNANKPII